MVNCTMASLMAVTQTSAPPVYTMDVNFSTNISTSYANDSDSFQPPQAANHGMTIPLYLYITISVVNAFIFFIGTLGNILVIIVVIKVRDMRTPTNVFLLNLSAADVLVLLICQPAALIEFYGKDRWFLGAFMCKLVPLMENGVLHVSILTMLAVTAERYNALCHPFKRRMSCTVSTTIKCIVAIWLTAYILSLPFLIMTNYEDARFYDGSPIKVCRTKIDEAWRYCYIVFVFVMFFVLPFFILICIYSKIICQLTSDTLKTLTRYDPSAIYTIRARKQVVYMLIFIIVLFFVSLFPIRVVTLWVIFTPSEDVTKIGLEAYLNLISWARLLMYVNSAGNPIIYSLTSTKFKMAFNRILRRYDASPHGSNVTARYSIRRRPGYLVSTPLMPVTYNNSRHKSKPSKASLSPGSEPGKQRRIDHQAYD